MSVQKSVKALYLWDFDTKYEFCRVNTKDDNVSVRVNIPLFI